MKKPLFYDETVKIYFYKPMVHYIMTFEEYSVKFSWRIIKKYGSGRNYSAGSRNKLIWGALITVLDHLKLKKSKVYR